MLVTITDSQRVISISMNKDVNIVTQDIHFVDLINAVMNAAKAYPEGVLPEGKYQVSMTISIIKTPEEEKTDEVPEPTS